jgi:16S rRNA processing protein RimM
MISKNTCILLGTLTRTHGIHGAVLLWLNDLSAAEFRKRETVFVEFDGLLVPFFIDEFHEKTRDTASIKFRDIHDETKAKELVGNAVYVLKTQVKRNKIQDKDMPRLEGYRVNDRNLGFVGIAGEIADIANNPLLRVHREGREYLIPVHHDIILEINDKEKLIVIEAPEGLFEL